MCSTEKLSAICRQVIATEVSKASVQVAQHNLQKNNVKNAEVFRVSSEEFTSAWKGETQLHRLATVDFQLLKLETILVDPPRAGLDDETVQLLKEFRQIVYVSCNPDTLHDNLLKVADTHTIKRFALFDQFPYTDHIECGVYLERKAEAGAKHADQLQTTEGVFSQPTQLQQSSEVGSSRLHEQHPAITSCASEQQRAADLSSTTEQLPGSNGVFSTIALGKSGTAGFQTQESRKRQRQEGRKESIAGGSETVEGKEGREATLS